MKKWTGPVPKKCQICQALLHARFYDAVTVLGWAHVCEECFDCMRLKLGEGLGQRYEEKSIAGGEVAWVKTAG